MEWLAEVWRRLLFLFRRRQFDRDLDEEMRLHLEMKARQAGTAAARREFGNATLMVEESREAWGWAGVEAWAADIKYATRALRKNPGFTAVAVMTLALGIGANAAIFSVINAALIKPLQFPHPEQLVLLFERDVLQQGGGRNPVSLANFLDWQAQNSSFSAIGVERQNLFNLAGDGTRFVPERIKGAICAWGMFPALGAIPLIGRSFSPEEDRHSARAVAVIGYGLWQRRFGGSTDILGRRIRLDSEDYEIVGVMPPSFTYPARGVEVWIPVQHFLSEKMLRQRGAHQFYVVGRLRPGIPIRQAAAELNSIQHRIWLDHQSELAGRGASVTPLGDESARRSRTTLRVLFTAVGCLLLIGCVNIANLLLARGAQRRRELAIRASIGAGRTRLLRQLLTESFVLSFTGAVAGLLLAQVLIAALASRAPVLLGNLDIDTSADVALDGRVFLFTAVTAVFVALITGFVPAWQAIRGSVIHSLRDGGRTATSGRSQHRFRSVLVATEVTLSTMLLIAAFLLIRSFAELQRVHPGLRTDHLLTAGLALPEARYRHRAEISAIARQLEERLKALPGVKSVGLITCLPVGGYCGDEDFEIEGRPLPPHQFRIALWRAATPEYFSTAGIPVLSGRAIGPQDGRGFDNDHPRESAIVISQSMVRKFWPQSDAIGQRIRFGDSAYRVVGIVGDVLIDLDEHPRPTMYIPLLEGANSSFYAVLHTESDPARLASAVRQEIGRINPDLPAYNIRTMADLLDESAAQRQFTMLVLTSFAALALVLAAIGLYGVLSYSVAQRMNEIGIRLALGAAQSQLRRLILAEGLRPAIVGGALGLAGASGTTRLFRSLLFGISPGDKTTYLTVPVLLLIVAAAACWVPACRATRIDPLEALRHE